MKKLFLLFIFTLSSCVITREMPKCELMQRGEECLTDHRCCNPPQIYNYQTHPSWWWWSKPIVNKTIIINKPNKPNKPSGRPNNKPNRKHRK